MPRSSVSAEPVCNARAAQYSCPAIQLSSYQAAQLSCYPAVQLSSCPAIQLSSCPVQLSSCPVQLSSCPAIKLSSYPAVELSSYPAIQLSSDPAIQLSSCPAALFAMSRGAIRRDVGTGDRRRADPSSHLHYTTLLHCTALCVVRHCPVLYSV